MPEQLKPPRVRSVRIVLAVVLGFVLVVAAVTPQVFVEETTGNEYLSWLAGGILPCLLVAWFAPKVSYRRRDGLLFLIMGAPSPTQLLLSGVLLRLVWRVAYLPHRDWPLRPDEIAAGRRTSYIAPLADEESEQPPVEVPAKPIRPSWARDVTTW